MLDVATSFRLRDFILIASLLKKCIIYSDFCLYLDMIDLVFYGVCVFYESIMRIG